jgi:hypothetical protein
MYLLCKIEPQPKHIHCSTPEGIVEGVEKDNVLVEGQFIPYPVKISWEEWLARTFDWTKIDGEWWWFTTDEKIWNKYNKLQGVK